ncbi:MAG: type II toxin-antitoxin system VapC family toxin [Pseudomonadota bacterium]
MIIDTSALLCILKGETGWENIFEAFQKASFKYISTGTCLEVTIVVYQQLGKAGVEELNRLLDALNVEFMVVTIEDVKSIAVAYPQYGKGQGHPAQLNFGDCFTYALAKRLICQFYVLEMIFFKLTLK